MKTIKNRLLFTVFAVILFVVPMMVVSASAAENEISFYCVYDYPVSDVVQAILDMAGQTDVEEATFDKIVHLVDSLECYLSEDRTIFLVDDGYLEEILPVANSEDESVYNWRPEAFYLSSDEDLYYAVPISTGGLLPDAELAFTAVYHGSDTGSSTVDTDLASVVNADMISSVLDEILELLPVVVVVIVGFVGLRKGISFLEGILHGA